MSAPSAAPKVPGSGPCARRLITLTPVATSDGFIFGTPKTPRDEKFAKFPFSSAAPTLITHGAAAYGLSVPFPGPEFPAEKTTLMPCLVSILVATLTGSFGS